MSPRDKARRLADIQFEITKLTEQLASFQAELAKVKAMKPVTACIGCEHFSDGFCAHFNQQVPENFQQKGCEFFEDMIPF